ncbi:VOC family protein [Thermogemmatispora carboxidivorans]|uniref:VOC family protein n=1 Tax=Thermogemmatispora carboxidivorans TaxID=1382306 RepID=UPI00069AAEA4|nr:VOC family protein [Thermogemmatispora carboxidivorans]
MKEQQENTPINAADMLPATTHIGLVALTVADLERERRFYEEVLGFQLIDRSERQIWLGAADLAGQTEEPTMKKQPLLLLIEQAEAPRSPSWSTGLYHFAILLPSRPALARSLAQLAASRYPLGGYADHLVSEALYLSDPEGNGIEIYRDRPRETWRWQSGQVAMATDPIDVRAMLTEGRAELERQPWRGLPAGTTIGHVHLRVADLRQAEHFYHQLLGFAITARMPGALFVSAGGYHHHLGLNTWESRGAPPPPEGSLGLRLFSIELPAQQDVERISERLELARWPFVSHKETIAVRDPWNHLLLFMPEGKRQPDELQGWLS